MVSAIILAAGESKRMGEKNKLTLPFRNGKSLIEHIISNLMKSDVEEIVVVLGHEAELIRNILLEYKIKIVVNAKYLEGMTTSIHAGIKGVQSHTSGYMICLSDLPYLRIDDYNYLIREFNHAILQNDKSIIVPTFDGQRGNPVLFSAHYKMEILNHKGKKGCKGVIKHNPQHVFEVKMKSNSILIDIDTPEDYKKFIIELQQIS